jgi:tetratricopeptide (TPR) repeat protein
MPGINEDRERQVVPLWRSFDNTTHRGELAPLSTPAVDRFSDEMISGLLREWKEIPSLSVASDLVSAAFTLGRFRIANDAAEFILSAKSATSPAKSIAVIYLDKGELPTGGSAATVLPGDEHIGITALQEYLYLGVRETRRQLVAYPRNPVQWINLARLYTSLGVQEKADRAMQAALSMAPENRFVLRAASRFLLHLGRKDSAHRVLVNATNIKSDPWVLAAEIATAAAIGRPSKFIKAGRRLLEIQRHPLFHLSELASALGTLESKAGNLRSARRLLELSLRHPAENSIAQAAWVSRKIGGIWVTGTSPTGSFEANAWLARNASKWRLALAEAARWQADQPFSSRPAIFGSYTASSVTEDYDLAVVFARQGLLSNPDDFALQNNLAFSLAMRGDVVDADRILRDIKQSRLSDVDKVVFEATSGLVAFRSGDAQTGRILYNSAVNQAKRLRNKSEYVARIYYALEELPLGSAGAEALRQQAIDGSTVLSEPNELVLVERLRNYKPG